MIKTIRFKTYRKRGTVRLGQDIICSLFEKVPGHFISIDTDRIESVQNQKFTGYLDDKSQVSLEYTFYHVRMFSGDLHDLHNDPWETKQ